ncbi:hypothetical protein [Nitrobacter sp. JJSN]
MAMMRTFILGTAAGLMAVITLSFSRRKRANNKLIRMLNREFEKANREVA